MMKTEAISHEELTQERLQFLVSYSPETGLFRRNVTTSGRAMAGALCGDMDGKGYIRLRVDGKRYSGHRLAWLYVHGYWPPHEIDHVNGCRTDNRISNLRLADTFTNKRNTPAYKNNKSGAKGVSWSVTSKKWRARIRLDGRDVNLGMHDTIESAHAAYIAAAKASFGEFARAA